MLPAVMAGRILAVGNLKGGTGKTTVAVDLGCGLARPRREVVLIDADSQGTATAWGDFLKILKLVDAPASRLALLQKKCT